MATEKQLLWDIKRTKKAIAKLKHELNLAKDRRRFWEDQKRAAKKVA